RGKATLAELAALPDSSWTTVRIDRSGRYRHPQVHEGTIAIKGIARPVRQIAVRNIGRDQPTLLITNDTTTKAKDLFARYAERMLIENELSAYIKGFQVDALTSGLALNVDADTTLTVIAGNIYRLLARSLKRYEHATPETIHEQFIDTTGRIDVTDDGATVTLARRTYTPVVRRTESRAIGSRAGLLDQDLACPPGELLDLVQDLQSALSVGDPLLVKGGLPLGEPTRHGLAPHGGAPLPVGAVQAGRIAV